MLEYHARLLTNSGSSDERPPLNLEDIIGCLAEPGEECRFRAMADALVQHRLFGAARKALEIMEKVWKCRDELTIDTDFAACVCSLGYMSLLV